MFFYYKFSIILPRDTDYFLGVSEKNLIGEIDNSVKKVFISVKKQKLYKMSLNAGSVSLMFP